MGVGAHDISRVPKPFPDFLCNPMAAITPCATGYFSGTSETAVNRSMRSEPNVKVLIRTGIVANTQVFFCLLFDHQDVACSNRDVRASRVIAGNRVGIKGHIGFNVVVTRS